ncbi:MAG: TetR/AcrR family transcriptional regulator [Polyangiaceae bacterium]
MPYTPEHKQRTRERIVDAASRLFRSQGYQGTGVDTLMAAAGLTRGGFYAHFRDKAELFAAALHSAFDESEANLLGGRLAELRGAAWVREAGRRYLRASHLRRPDQGCAIPALGVEVSRSEADVASTFRARVDHLLEAMAERIGGSPEDARRLATAMLASWVGALVMARAMPGRRRAEELLDTVREHWDRVAETLEPHSQ